MCGLWGRVLTTRLLLIRRIKRDGMNISELQYKYAQRRVDDLLESVTEMTLPTAPENLELSIMSGVVEEYETCHYPIEKLTVAEVIKQGLKAKGMTQKELAKAVGLSTSRISDFTNGKSEPTLATAGEICRVLNIVPAAMLSL